MATVRKESSNVAESPVTDPPDLERLPVHGQVGGNVAPASTHVGRARQYGEHRFLGAHPCGRLVRRDHHHYLSSNDTSAPR
jgi:hypothetical protein